jgi:long-subunit fatty acid transport protein
MPVFHKRLILFLLGLSFFTIIPLSAQDTTKTLKKPRNNDILNRIDFGGYLGAQFGNVTYIEVSPIASYRVTEKFHAGLGLTYQYYKVNYTGAPDYSTSSYGGSIFMRYFIWRDLFVHAEYAPLYVTFYDYYFDNSGSYISRDQGSAWVNDILIGGGYRQMIGAKASINLMVLWNVNESFYSPYSNPIIRIGFGVGL